MTNNTWTIWSENNVSDTRNFNKTNSKMMKYENLINKVFNEEDEPENEWSIEELEHSQFSLPMLNDLLYMVAEFRKKYPNDDYVQTFENIVRDEVCMLVGGSIHHDI